MKAKEASIITTMITHAQRESAKNPPKETFIPKKLAIRVGGISMSETSVKTFMILFWSRLMIPITVF